MKCRVDFVTNSSSSSFVILEVNSHSFADIIRRFQDELEEQGWYQINELDGSKVSLYGDEMFADTPSNVSDIVSSLARLFYEEVYVPGDTTAQIFWLKNRKPEEWRDKRDVDSKVEIESDGFIEALKSDVNSTFEKAGDMIET